MTKVVCLICGKEFETLGNHLKKHGINCMQYKERFPGAKTISDEYSQTLSEKRKGKPSYIRGMTKETHEGLRRGAEKHSKNRKIFFASEKGQLWLDENWRGINSFNYGRKTWNTGKTKETDNRVKESAKKLSKTKKEFFATEKGQQWLDKHNRGENNSQYGKKPWNLGKTKETNEQIKEGGEKLSKTKKEFFATNEGQKWLDENFRGENAPMFGKVSWSKGKTKETEEGLMRISESKKGDKNPSKRIEVREKMSKTRKGKPSHMKGKTKETDDGLRKRGEKLSKTKKAFFATEEGQKWLDNNFRGENHPCFGKEVWNYGKTKESDDRVKKYGEGISKTKKEFFASEEGQQWIEEHLKGENGPMYGKEGYWKGKVGPFAGKYHSEETIEIMSKVMTKNWQNPDFVKMMVESWSKRPTQPESELEGLVQLLFPKEYKYNGNFELGITIGGKIPDFVNVNGKKKAIEMFGDYWHEGEDPQVRIDLFKEYGWDLLVIWEHELKDKDAVIQKILKFHGVESDYIIPQKTMDMWMDSNKK
jgi:hypothetical protein